MKKGNSVCVFVLKYEIDKQGNDMLLETYSTTV